MSVKLFKLFVLTAFAVIPFTGKAENEAIDDNVVWHIEPRFDKACRFSEGLAAVRIASDWNYIDKKGKLQYNSSGILSSATILRDFSEGMAEFEYEQKWGYINKKFEIVIKPQFSYSTNFSEGLASAGHYYINKKGDKVIELGSAWGGVFSEGLGRVRGGERGNYIGYIDRVGKFIIEPLFSLSSGWFHEGLAPAQTDSDGKWGFINKKGEFVIKPRFEYACSFSEGLAAVKLDEDGKWGFINKKGEFVIKPQFEIAHKFSEGLSSVQKERGGKWGYIKNPLKMSK